MVLEIALILVAMIVLAALELRLSWSLGRAVTAGAVTRAER